MAIMGTMGYRKRTAFLRADGGADFRVLDRLRRHGISLGHVGNSALGLTTLVG